MYTLRKNKESIEVINILVYAEDKKILWEYRNILEQVSLLVKEQVKTKLKVNPILTISYHTVLEMISALQGGIDIYLSDSRIEENAIRFLDKKIQQEYPKCHIITKEDDVYSHSYCLEDWRKEEYLKVDPEILKEELLAIIQEVQEEA